MGLGGHHGRARVSADVLAAQAGDPAAFGRLVDRWSGAVCAVCLGILRNVQASDEAAQDTFLAAWQNLGKLREPRSFGPWIRALARNHALSQQRATVRREQRVVADDEAVQRAAQARDVLLEAEEARLLEQALDALPDDARDVMVLYYREGQSVRQVAELLGLSETAVKKRLSRARALVREDMLAQLGDLARSTAPGAAFTAMVLTSLAPAPAAAAAGTIAVGAAKTATAGLALGAALGTFGILLGYGFAARQVKPERLGTLRLARNLSLAGVVGVVGAGAAFGPVGLLVGLVGFVGWLGVVQFVVLPQVFELTPEEAADPHKVFYARVGTFLGALGWLIGGACGLAGAWWGWAAL